MSFTTIQAILDTQLQTVAGLPVLQLENTRYEPKTGVPFVRPTFMPAETARLSNTDDLLQGLYQIDVFYPTDKGTATASAMADLIKSAFVRGATYTTNSVNVHVVKSYREAGTVFQQFYKLSVMVQWNCQLPKV